MYSTSNMIFFVTQKKFDFFLIKRFNYRQSIFKLLWVLSRQSIFKLLWVLSEDIHLTMTAKLVNAFERKLHCYNLF